LAKIEHGLERHTGSLDEIAKSEQLVGVRVTIIVGLLLAHEWYPSQCCGGHDCLQVPCATVVHMHGYWEYLPKHVIFNAAQVSPDNYCHVCINEANNVGLCLFVPDVNS
jgi:hypothetical protein